MTAVVTCVTCNRRGVGAKPTCPICLPPVARKRKPAEPLTDADRQYLALKAANGTSF